MAKQNFSNWQNFKPGGFDPFAQAEGFYLDEAAGEKVIQFFESCLTHVRGKLKGTPFKLDMWLRSIVGHLYGWKNTCTKQRRFQELLLFVPRKNAKSLLACGLALVELIMGDPNSPELVIGSGDRLQAAQMLDTIKLMIKNEKELKTRLEVYKNIIKYPARDGWLKVVSSEAYNLHGGNFSACFVDETAVVKRDLVEVMSTSQGSREEPLFINTSTAGYDRHSILYEKYEYAKKLQSGIINDPSFFGVIYEIEKDDKWDDEKTWYKANPGLGRSIKLDFLRRECERAKASPAFENTFRMLYLNQWVEANNPFLQMDKFDACCGELPDLKGRVCYGGLDLSTTTDLSAFVLCFPPVNEDESYYVIPYAWCPGDAILIRSKKDRVPYNVWEKQGFIETTPGDVIKYEYIMRRIDQAARDYDVKGISYDRWGSTKIIQDIASKNLMVIEMGQGYKSMSPPTKELMKMILEKKIRFPENPVLRWNASNLVVETDAAGNLKPSKKRSTEKIDLMVSLIMALDAAVRNEYSKQSVYEDRSLRFL